MLLNPTLHHLIHMKITFIGHRHIISLERASNVYKNDYLDFYDFVQLRSQIFVLNPNAPGLELFEASDQNKIREHVGHNIKGSSLIIL